MLCKVLGLLYLYLVCACHMQALDVPQHSVSGISSGGSMAVNHLVAFSNITEGAAIVAGSPYGCNIIEDDTHDFCGVGWPSDSSFSHALDRKMAAYMHKRAASGLIDPLLSLKGRRVYLYSGSKDIWVNQRVMRAVSRQLAPWVGLSSMIRDFSTPSTHGWVVDGSDCGPSNQSWCASCCCSVNVLLACHGHDLAGNIMHHLLDRALPNHKGDVVPSNLLHVPQERYVPPGRTLSNTGLWHTGYVYAPKACRGTPSSLCSVHVHYHGCVWGAEYKGTFLMRHLGLMDWAEVMNVVLVFPQASSTVDWEGCWDWTGEVDPLFDTRQGPQLTFVMSFLADLFRILAEDANYAVLV